MKVSTALTGGPAFPGSNNVHQSGMTLRDYFAAAGMAQLARMNAPPNSVARWAYEIADAMLAERDK
jgi:hypothetical protein